MSRGSRVTSPASQRAWTSRRRAGRCWRATAFASAASPRRSPPRSSSSSPRSTASRSTTRSKDGCRVSSPTATRSASAQLLQHTSGLFDYAADPATFQPFATHPNYSWNPRELVAIASKHTPNFAPGKGWGYSNTNYVLLGLIVEAATGNPIGIELERRIFRPLHLWATTFDTDGNFGNRSSGRRTARFAHGYSTIGGHVIDATDLNPSWGYAAGAITSTADDLATFYGALMRGKLVSKASLRAMTTTVPLSSTAAYGLGLLQVKTSCGSFWGHDGGTFGYTSNVFVSADGQHVAILLVNRGRLTARQQQAFTHLAEQAACDTATP